MGVDPAERKPGDGRSATAKAAEWVSRVMTISMGMVLPGLAGYWLDQRLGTQVLFLLLGFVIGGYLAFLQLRVIAATTKKRNESGQQ